MIVKPQRLSMLQRMVGSQKAQMMAFVRYNSVRVFSTQTVPEPKTISELHEMGYQNLKLTKEHGLDYESICNSEDYGVTNQHTTFKSFEEEINAQYDIQPTEATVRDTRRVGAIGYKVGCTHFWDKWGKLQGCTVIQLDRCQVTQVKTQEKDGINAMQLGIGEKRVNKIKKPQIGHLLKYNLPPKAHFGEFVVTPENFLPVGYVIGPRHFKIGQWVDVQATSIGKGFAGTIKRWNFAQQYNTHGNSKAHRLPGSIGQCEFPGKVFKGKKMAGRLGGKSATVLNQKVLKVDTDRALIYVKGNVPGPINGVVRIRDAAKKIERQVWDLRYPTFIASACEDPKEAEKLQVFAGDAQDPFENDFHENDVVSGKDQDDDN